MKFTLSGDRSGKMNFRYQYDGMWRYVVCNVELGAEAFSGCVSTASKRFTKRKYRIYAFTEAIRNLPRLDRAELWANYWSTHKTNRQASIDRFIAKNAWRVMAQDKEVTI